MGKPRKKPKEAYCYPATNLLELYPKDEKARFLADVFGVSRQTIIRWRNRPEESKLHIFKADYYAIKLGIHPANIWSDWYEKQEEYYGK